MEKDILYSHQKKVFELAVRKLTANETFLLEAGTGWGKTILGGAIAQRFEGKNVIIATENNQLAYDFLRKIISVFNYKKEPEIIIGKNNYLDVNLIDDVAPYFEDEEKIKKYVDKITKQTKDGLYKSLPQEALFETIFKKNKLVDESSKQDVIRLSCMGKRLEYAGNLQGEGVKITNHFYLLLAVFYGNLNLTDTVLIIDEADRILQSATSLFSNSFSIFSFSVLLKESINLIKNRQDRGVKTAVKSLAELRYSAIKSMRALCNSDFIGNTFYHETEEFKKYTESLRFFWKLSKSNDGLRLLKKLNYPDRLINTLLEDVKNLSSIFAQQYSGYLTFSPVRGYPSWIILNEPVGAKLKGFWKKARRSIVMSATLSVPEDNRYVCKKLYMPDDFPKVYVGGSPFDKNKCKIYSVSPSFASPVQKNGAKDKEQSICDKWLDDAVPLIYDNTADWGNAIVFVNSYNDVNRIYDRLSAYKDRQVIKVSPDGNNGNKIEEFKNSGGILISPRFLGRGTDLPGKLLEKIFICRLPYLPPTDITYVNLSRGGKYERSCKDMLIELKQEIGRGIRTKDDECEVFILDSRIYGDKIKNRVFQLLNAKGDRQKAALEELFYYKHKALVVSM